MRPGRAGTEAIIEIIEPAASLVGFVVVDSTRLGPAFGGVRLRAYGEERDALIDAIDLAAGMTVKAALAELPCGGGKIVLIDRPGLVRARAMEAVGKVLNAMRGRFFAGRDYGMRRADLVRLRRATRFAADEAPGAMGDLGDATARGTVAAIRAALAFAGDRAETASPEDLRGVRVAVQGLGTVGLPLVRRLLGEGAVVVGADVDAGAVLRALRLGARIVPPGKLASVDADVFVPAALGGTIDEAFAARCRSRLVCGPANNALASPAAERTLRRRGIWFVPDVLAGAGALIAGALHQLRGIRDPGPAIDRIGARVTRLLREVDRTGLPPSQVLRCIVERRLSKRA